MKSVIVLIVIAVMTLLAFGFVWTNRASEKIVTSTVPIAVAALLGVFFVGWVFGGEDDYQVVFPTVFIVDSKTELQIFSPRMFNLGRFWVDFRLVPELKLKRPELFSREADPFATIVYHHLLQRCFIDFLVQLYRGSWKADQFRVDIAAGRFGIYGSADELQPATSRILTKRDLEKALAGNWFAQYYDLPTPQLALPPGSELTITPPTKGKNLEYGSQLKIENRFCTVTLTVERTLPIGTIGDYRIMAGLSEQEAHFLVTNIYFVRARIHYNRLRSGHPDMKQHKEWARQLVDEVRNQFDEELIWSQVKEDDMRMRHYPPELVNPHGRVPHTGH